MKNYQITIKSNAGTATVTVQGELPDGEHVITGHDDGNLISLHAERRSELGRYMIHTQHAIDRQQHAQAASAPQVVHADPGIPAGDARFDNA